VVSRGVGGNRDGNRDIDRVLEAEEEVRILVQKKRPQDKIFVF
jgi:hypothetical protein